MLNWFSSFRPRPADRAGCSPAHPVSGLLHFNRFRDSIRRAGSAAGSRRSLRRQPGRWLAAVVLGLSMASGPGLPTAAFAQSIDWASGAFTRAEPMTSAEAAKQLKQLGSVDGHRRVVIQFERPMSPADRAALDAAGVSVLSPIGHHAFFASLDPDRMDERAIAGVDALRYVAPIERRAKMSARLFAGEIGEWTIVQPAITLDAGGEAPEVIREAIVALNILFHRDVTREESRAALARAGAVIESEFRSINGALVHVAASGISDVVDLDEVQWVESPLPLLTELNANNRVATQADVVQAAPYELDGTGVVVMVYDGGRALASHNDFGGRLTTRDSSSLSNHATHVAGTIGGDGAVSGGEQRGMAPNVTLESYGFQWGSGGIFLYTNPGDIEVDYFDAMNSYGAVIANNSIGTNTATNGFPCEITGEYGLTDTIIDAIVRGAFGDTMRIVWANGNERQSSNCGDLYYTTAPPACAKNHLTVGALNNNDDSVTSFTSWGPAKDGRLKPDLSAPGCRISGGIVSASTSGGYSTLCGTSMASPTVAGLAALMLQDFREQFPGRPDFLPSMMKALLIHNARDIENPGPDYKTGYGIVQIQDTIDFMRTGYFVEGVIGHGDVQEFIVQVVTPGQPLKVTLVWDDPPASPNAIPALVNDLDLLVTGPDGTFFPWTLNPANPAAPAVRTGPDRLNNIEQVLVDHASPGTWTVTVTGYSVPEGPQTFSLAASPSLVTTQIAFPQGLPEIIEPGVTTILPVEIVSTGETLVPGSAMVHVRTSGPGFVSSPLTLVGGNHYVAVLPATTCAVGMEFFVTAEGSQTGTVSFPAAAPSVVITPAIGVLSTIFEDQFDDDLGWTAGVPDDDATTGHWERANPVGTTVSGTQVQPADAFVGEFCYITGQHPGGGAGANDVDHGKTTLLTPVFDLSGLQWAQISYRRWYTNSAGANPFNDIFVVDISNDGGQTWTNVETVGPSGPGVVGGWIWYQFAAQDVIPLTDQVMLRFIASDYDPQALVEAAIDDFRIEGFACLSEPTSCPADLDGSGSVDSSDLLILFSQWGACSGCSGDLDGDGVVDSVDLLTLLGQWGPCSN